nr:hypothetical protein [Ramlibacter paludis]
MPSRPPRMQSAAYSPAFKALATVLVFGACAWLVMLWQGGKLGAGSSLATWFLAALAMMLYTWWCIVRSVTTLDGEQLKQTWVWTKKMELRELAYGKLIRVRGLEWLIAPRLYVRTLLGKFNVFYAAEPAMVAEFERLVKELAEFRGR